MARCAKIVGLCFETIANNLEITDISWYKDKIKDRILTQLNNCLCEKPDLIITPECCNRVGEWKYTQKQDFYRIYGDEFQQMMSDFAKEHKVNIAYACGRYVEEDKEFPYRNSVVYYDREGKVAGIYDKNLLVPGEHTVTRIGHGKLPEELIQLDFGTVATAICFDLHDERLLDRYAELNPDLIVFSSFFTGNVWREMWALRCKAYLASSIVPHMNGRIIDPFGNEIASSSDTRRYSACMINFDYKVIHSDENEDWRSFKLSEAKKKYGDGFDYTAPNGTGCRLIQCNMTDKTIDDIIEEYNIETYEHYFGRAKGLRKEYLGE